MSLNNDHNPDPSPYTIKVLFNGFSTQSGTDTLANCSCTLIKGPLNIIVDTMTAWDGTRLTEAIAKEGLSNDSINYVVCTHGHSDHIGCNYLFQNATHIVSYCISHRDIYKDNTDLVEGREMELDRWVKVVPTPGHSGEDVSVVVETKDMGVVVVAGDLFENEEDLKDENIWKNAGSVDSEQQEVNRAKMLKVARWIVPGHGRIFRNPFMED